VAKDGQETEIKEKDVSDAMGTDDTQLAIQGKDTQYLQVSYPRPGPLISFSEMVDY
jgi:hypothetical protein